ncbi:hypothetical protein ACFL2V_19330 [Pseudomonadota bacterium]
MPERFQSIADLTQEITGAMDSAFIGLGPRQKESAIEEVSNVIPEIITIINEAVADAKRGTFRPVCSKETLMMRLSDLPLDSNNPRILQAIQKALKSDDPYLFEIAQKTGEFFLRAEGMGKRSVRDLQEALSDKRLKLGMCIPASITADIESGCDKERTVSENPQNMFLTVPIDRLPWAAPITKRNRGLVTRTKNGIRNLLQRSYPEPVYTFEILTFSREEILRGSKNLGEFGVQLLERTLRKIGLGFNMQIDPALLAKLKKQ